MKNIILSLAFGLAFLCNAATNTITYQATDTGTGTWSRSLHLPQFNPGIGTLLSVTVGSTTEIAQTLKGENMNAAAGCNASLALTNFAAIICTNGFASYTNSAVASSNTPLSAYDGVFDYSGPSGFSTLTTTINAMPVVVTNSANFVGTGNVLVSAKSSGQSADSSNCGQLNTAVTSTTTVTLSVSYTYVQ